MASRRTDQRKLDRFHPEEDLLLCRFVTEHGSESWREAAAALPGRTARQCRDRWRHYLQLSTPEQPWTKDEDLLLRRAVAYHGARWRIIRPFFPTRSDSDLRQRWILHCFRKEGYQSDIREIETESEKDLKAITELSPDDTTDNSKTEASQLGAMIWGSKTGFWFEIENGPTYPDY
jgi:hypothetical protein